MAARLRAPVAALRVEAAPVESSLSDVVGGLEVEGTRNAVELGGRDATKGQ